MNKDVKKYGARASRRIDCLGPGKDVLMPDIYADEHAVEETSLEVVVPGGAPEIDQSRGFNPRFGNITEKNLTMLTKYQREIQN